VGQEETEVKLPTSRNGTGGTANSFRRIDSVTLQIKMRDYSAENLSMALFGHVTAVAAGAVTDESHTAYLDGMLPFDYLPDPDQTITVTDGTGTTTYVEGTDYELRTGGIYVLSGGSVGDGSTVLVDYTKKAADVIEMLTHSGKNWRVFLSGLNKAQSGEPHTLEYYKVRFGAAPNLGFIQPEHAELALTGTAQLDTSKPSDGSVSQYGKIQKVAQA
jgi:hypothetical protein